MHCHKLVAGVIPLEDKCQFWLQICCQLGFKLELMQHILGLLHCSHQLQHCHTWPLAGIGWSSLCHCCSGPDCNG